MKILVIGGSGGIGKAIVNHLVSHYPQVDVAATYHRNQPEHQQSLVRWYPLDVEDEASIKQLAQQFEQLDWIINCVGMLHTQHQKPEKNLASIDPDFFLKSMAVNCLPTLLIAKHFQPLLRKSAHPCLATVSAKVGSITDNQLGGWYSYRSSKAALNMALKSIAIEWGRLMPKSVVVALHPGTTDTQLSKPFQTNVPEGKLFTPTYVATQLITILHSLKASDSGSFIAYDGERLPW
ncbi:SDR family oxidoreductase [Vibrio sp. 16]|uniref:SDR family oxidoreductase n=1 Tax=Vibrio sp. 16 TaxID=391586 RepID=UPI00018F2974|nr:SDR family oxidoreductase [Vibrio sp. 16]EED28356.1 C factor cell-cell signaling protein [Vibrio sp. 16]CAK4074458.1 hypothetical protein VDT1_3415 [Vibrio sp. 16]